VPITSSIHSADTTSACDGRTDGQTDRLRAIANTALAQRRAGKNVVAAVRIAVVKITASRECSRVLPAAATAAIN